MTKVQVRIPVTFELDCDNFSSEHAGRMIQSFTVINKALTGFAATIALGDTQGEASANVAVIGVDPEAATVSWDNDPEVEGVSTWNVFGQRIDGRYFSLAPRQGEKGVTLSFSENGQNPTDVIAAFRSEALANAFGEALCNGTVTVHPKHAFS